MPHFPGVVRQSALLLPTARLLALLTGRDRRKNEAESTKCREASPLLTGLHALGVSQSSSRTLRDPERHHRLNAGGAAGGN